MIVHKFHLGQMVDYFGKYAPRGPYIVTAKLPERDGEFEYHIRHAREQHERMARESQLMAVSENEVAPVGSKGKR